MQKEALKLKNILNDLASVAENKYEHRGQYFLGGAIGWILLAVIAGVYFKSVLLGLLVSLVAPYFIVRFVIEIRDYRTKKSALTAAINRGDISISVEKLSHIAMESIFEPHVHFNGRKTRSHTRKEVPFLHFMSGGSCRIPEGKLYAWSRDYYISQNGLENISLPGDEFYHIVLQGYPDVDYPYPCKSFTLGEDLKLKQ